MSRCDTAGKMDLNPLGRFSSRAKNYAKYRPSYPAGVIDVLRRDCGLSQDSKVADIGSGTGLLAKLFLDFGCEVFGVEPNAEMRQGGEACLAGYGRFHSLNGQAENTGLRPASMDLVAAGQAFHWFEPVAARVEFRRILRRPAWVALIWNERRVAGDPFLEGYEELLERYASEYARVDHRRIDRGQLSAFFEHSDWKTASFENDQCFDLDGVRGRLLSSSYAPPEGAPGHEELMQELDRLFTATQQDGKITFAYETKMHYGPLDHSPLRS